MIGPQKFASPPRTTMTMMKIDTSMVKENGLIKDMNGP